MLASCGGETTQQEQPREPQLPATLAQNLASRSDEVAELLAAGDECTAAARADDLRGAVIDAVNDGDVPARLQEELTGAANALASRIECVEAPPPPPPPPATTAEEDDDEDDEERGKEKDKEKKEKEKPEETVDEEEDLPLETVIDTVTEELPTLPTDTTGDTTTETQPGESP